MNYLEDLNTGTTDSFNPFADSYDDPRYQAIYRQLLECEERRLRETDEAFLVGVIVGLMPLVVYIALRFIF